LQAAFGALKTFGPSLGSGGGPHQALHRKWDESPLVSSITEIFRIAMVSFSSLPTLFFGEHFYGLSWWEKNPHKTVFDVLFFSFHFSMLVQFVRLHH
jgi:hypothetical protein